MKTTTKFHLKDEDILDNFGGKQPEIGTEVILLHVVDESRPSTNFWRIYPTAHQPAAPTDGISGNMNAAIKRFHGWRGTTNGLSVTAHGVHAIVSVKALHPSPELYYDAPICEVTIGNDLHPDWE